MGVNSIHYPVVTKTTMKSNILWNLNSIHNHLTRRKGINNNNSNNKKIKAIEIIKEEDIINID